MMSSNFWEMENEVSPTTAPAWESAIVIQYNKGILPKNDVGTIWYSYKKIIAM